MNFLWLFAVIKFLIFFFTNVESMKTWTYELKSVDAVSSDPENCGISLRIERVSRGVFALSGEWKFNLDIIDGDENEVELKTFRSSNSDGNYVTIPIEMSRRHLYKALNTTYKNVLMNTFKECSDLPYFEDEFEPPLEKKTYVLDKCQISQEGLPNHVETGTYKTVLTGYGEVDWQIELVFEVEPNDF